MAGRGPAPEPTALKIIKGIRDRRQNKSEPKPKRGRPQCPRWLGGRARTVWRQVVAILSDMGVLTKADGIALARYCDALVRWRDAADEVDQAGITYEAGDLVKPNPALRAYLDLNSMLTRLEQEFGLTPSARTRIQIDASAAIDEFDEFLKVKHG